MSAIYDMGGCPIPDAAEISRLANEMRKIPAQTWPIRDDRAGCWWKSVRVPYKNKHGYISVQVAFDPSTNRWSKRFYDLVRASQAPA